MALELDQFVVTFLHDVSAAMDKDAWEVVAQDTQVDGPGTSGIFIQRCQIEAFVVKLKYKGRCVDFAALGQGSMYEALNLLPWKATLQFRRLRLYAVEGLPALGKCSERCWWYRIRIFWSTALPRC